MCVSNVDAYVGNVQNMRYTQDIPNLENMHSMQIMQNFEDKRNMKISKMCRIWMKPTKCSPLLVWEIKSLGSSELSGKGVLFFAGSLPAMAHANWFLAAAENK